MSRLLPSVLLLTLIGCTGDKTGGGGDDTGSGADDTGGGTDDTGGGDSWAYEEGCISLASTTAGTFASIEDALLEAVEGDTIDLSLCKGELVLTASLSIEIPLTIAGRGSETNTLVGPTDAPAVSITADSVTLSGLTLQSGVTAVEVVSTDSVVLSDIRVEAAGDWGLAAVNAENLSLDGVVLAGNPTGGAYLSGGEALLTDVTISGNVGFGLYVDNADVTVIGSDISGNTWSDEAAQQGGIGALVTGGGVLTLDGTLLENNDLINVYTNTASAAILESASLVGSLYSLYVNEGEISVTDSEIIDGFNHGIYAFSDHPVVISGLTLSGNPKNTEEMLDEDWGVDGFYYGTGALIVSDDITITDSTVTGYNDCGMLLANNDPKTGVAALERVTFADNSRRGLYLLTNTTATDLEVSGIIEAEDQAFTEGGPCSDAGNYVGVLMGAYTLDWQGGSVHDNAGYGISALQATATISGLTASDNRCSSYLNYLGSVDISDSTFTRPGIGTDFSASVVDYYSTDTTITDSSFSDARTAFDDVFTYTSGGSTYEYIYYESAGMDVYSYYGGGLSISGTTFESGVQGLYLYETPATLTENTWSDYRQVLYVYGEEVTLTNSTIDGFSDEAVYCSSGSIEIEDTTFASGTNESVPYDYYVNGSLTDTGSNEYLAYGTRLYSCTSRIQDVSYTDLDGQAIYVSDYTGSDHEYSNLTVSNVGGGTDDHSAIYLYNYSSAYPTTVWMSSVDIADASTGSGLEVVATSYAALDVEVIGLSVARAAGNGVTLSGESVTANISYADISEAQNFGLSSDEATAIFRDSTIDASGTSGAELRSGADMEFADNTVSSSAEYGLICGSDVDITDCTGNTLTDNTDGDTLNCPAACAGE